MGRVGEIKELTRARVLLFLREPEAVFWVFVFPIILAVVLGFAFGEKEALPSRVGMPADVKSDALATMLDASPDLEVVRFEDEQRSIRRTNRPSSTSQSAASPSPPARPSAP